MNQPDWNELIEKARPILKKLREQAMALVALCDEAPEGLPDDDKNEDWARGWDMFARDLGLTDGEMMCLLDAREHLDEDLQS